jgi:cytosine/adenosine deaminase-related metal-dependent hydrolase
VSAPPIANGIVRCESGRITYVGAPDGTPIDRNLGRAALIPGLVNSHTHLDLSEMRGLAPPGRDFVGWLRAVIGHRRSNSLEKVANSVRDGLKECTGFGTTLVGDISAFGASWDICCAAPLRAVVFYELLGLPPDRAVATREAARSWLQSHTPTPTCRPGLSPHAPYSVRASLFDDANYLCDDAGAVLATHLAESPAELQLLETCDGPFVAFLQELGVWDPDGLETSPAKVIRSCASHNVRTLLVHGNYLRATTLIPPHATLIYCPRTHQAFGHPRHPLADFVARGVRVALGTDSLASNPDLDILAEARFVRSHFPELRGEQILRMITINGAEALGFDDVAGSLDVGKSADLVVVPISDDANADPYDLVLRSDAPVSDVMFRGDWLEVAGT